MPTIDTDGMSASEVLGALTEAALECHYRDRDQFCAAVPLDPGSLCGSYFRAPDQNDPDAESAWLEGESCRVISGMIVGQPFATSTTTMYLVEFYGDDTMTGRQQLIEIDRMLSQKWAFYDTEGWLQSGGVQGDHKKEAER